MPDARTPFPQPWGDSRMAARIGRSLLTFLFGAARYVEAATPHAMRLTQPPGALKFRIRVRSMCMEVEVRFRRRLLA